MRLVGVAFLCFVNQIPLSIGLLSGDVTLHSIHEIISRLMKKINHVLQNYYLQSYIGCCICHIVMHIHMGKIHNIIVEYIFNSNLFPNEYLRKYLLI